MFILTISIHSYLNSGPEINRRNQCGWDIHLVPENTEITVSDWNLGRMSKVFEGLLYLRSSVKILEHKGMLGISVLRVLGLWGFGR